MATRKPVAIVGDHIVEITAPDTIDPSILPATSAAGRTFPFFMS